MRFVSIIAAISGLVTAILKYFPPKSAEDKKAKERKDDVGKIHKETEEFEKSRDTSRLGDFD